MPERAGPYGLLLSLSSHSTSARRLGFASILTNFQNMLRCSSATCSGSANPTQVSDNVYDVYHGRGLLSLGMWKDVSCDPNVDRLSPGHPVRSKVVPGDVTKMMITVPTVIRSAFDEVHASIRDGLTYIQYIDNDRGEIRISAYIPKSLGIAYVAQTNRQPNMPWHAI